MASLKDLFVSKVRVKLIQIFLNKPQEMFYVRQLVRLSEEEINAVRRELARLEVRGMVKSEPRANRLYYFFQKQYKRPQQILINLIIHFFDHHIQCLIRWDSTFIRPV